MRRLGLAVLALSFAFVPDSSLAEGGRRGATKQASSVPRVKRYAKPRAFDLNGERPSEPASPPSEPPPALTAEELAADSIVLSAAQPALPQAGLMARQGTVFAGGPPNHRAIWMSAANSELELWVETAWLGDEDLKVKCIGDTLAPIAVEYGAANESIYGPISLGGMVVDQPGISSVTFIIPGGDDFDGFQYAVVLLEDADHSGSDWVIKSCTLSRT